MEITCLFPDGTSLCNVALSEECKKIRLRLLGECTLSWRYFS